MEDRAAFPRFLASELPGRPASECRFQVIPVPYEATVSYGGGTADGPRAILEASSQLEVWTGRSNPSLQGIHTRPAVDCEGDAETVLLRIEQAVADALREGPQGDLPPTSLAPLPSVALPACLGARTIPFLLGGEHTVTLGALRALKKQYGRFGVIQFDAHADLRDTYQGSPYSHACVMRRAVEDLDLPLFQVGVRSLSPEEEAYRRNKHIPCLDARTIYFPKPWPSGGTKGKKRPLPHVLPVDFPDMVYLTFDVDAFDASLMPATGTPEPGGLFWIEALRFVERCLAGRRTIGFDVTELAPLPQMHAPTYTAARLVYELMGLLAE